MSHRKGWRGLALAMLVLAVLLAGCGRPQEGQPLGVAPTDTRAGGTAATTFRNVRILNDLSVNDDTTLSGLVTVGGDMALAGPLSVTAPTAVATTTPAAVINSTGVSALLDVRKAATPVFTVGNTGAVTSSGGQTLSGGQALSGLFKLSAATSVTVTNGAAFAIGGGWQPITAAGAVTPTITIPAAGVQACIVNNSNQTVTIVDTGNQVLTGNFAMGQYDVLCGHSDGTRFVEMSRANN